MNKLEEATRKTLVSQTSDQLFNKLTNAKLFGTSKEIALGILKERKAKGKFTGDLAPFEVATKKVAIEKEVTIPSVEKTIKTEKTEKLPKEPKEQKLSKRAEQFQGWTPTFKKGQKVKFIPFRETAEVNGEIVTSYPYQPKKGDLREDVRIKLDSGKVVVKNGNEVKVIK